MSHNEKVIPRLQEFSQISLYNKHKRTNISAPVKSFLAAKEPRKKTDFDEMKFEISLIFFSFSFYWQWVKHAKSMLKLDKKKWKPALLWVSIILPKRLWIDLRRDSLVLFKLLSLIVCFFVFHNQEPVGYTYVQ